MLNDIGYTVLRLTENEVRYDIDNVVKVIEDTIEECVNKLMLQ